MSKEALTEADGRKGSGGALDGRPEGAETAHRVALATGDGLSVNRHFREAEEFQIVDIGKEAYRFVERRKAPGKDPAAAEAPADRHSEGGFEEVVALLSDCEAIFVAKIGPGASQFLAQHGIRAFEVPGVIDHILQKVIERKVLDRFGLNASVGGTGGKHDQGN